MRRQLHDLLPVINKLISLLLICFPISTKISPTYLGLHKYIIVNWQNKSTMTRSVCILSPDYDQTLSNEKKQKQNQYHPNMQLTTILNIVS